MTRVMVVSAHPDDEVLGCGGTLLKHKRENHEIFWLIATRLSEQDGASVERIETRNAEIEEVARRLGVRGRYQLDFPTTSLSSTALTRLIPAVAEIFAEVRPNIIYVTNRSDAHSDHRVLFQAVSANCKSFRHPYVERLLMYECLSETEFAPALAENAFLPNLLVDVSPFFEEKLSILEVYKSEIADHPFPRSLRNVEALGVFRGALAGVEYAEAFQLVREIWK